MAFPHCCSRSPLPAQQTLWDNDCNKHMQGQVPPSPFRPLSCLQKCSKNGDFRLCNVDDSGESSLQRHYKPAPKLEIKTVVACLHGYGDPPRNSRDSVMGNLVTGGFVSAINFSGFGRVYGKLFDKSVFPASPNLVYVNAHAFNANSDELPHLGFTGGLGSGLGSGGDGGGYNRHNFGKGDSSGHHDGRVVFLGMQALFEGVKEGKLLALGLGNLVNGHAPESDDRDWKSEDSVRREQSQRMKAFDMSKDVSDISYARAFTDQFSHTTKAVFTLVENLYRLIPLVGSKFLMDNQELIATASVQVGAVHGYLTSIDQDDESLVEGHSLNKVLDMDRSYDMEQLSLQPGEMNTTASKTQTELEKHSFSRTDALKDVALSSVTASDRFLQGVMGWFDQLSRPAFANKQVAGYEPSVKVEQVEQQESRVLSGEGGIKSLKVDSETGGKPPGAKQSDVDALKRLQREAFFELMKLREKLEKLEQVTQARQKLEQLGAARTHLKGQIKAGTAFVILEDDNSRHSRDSLERAGMQTGLDVKFTFETPFRENDVLITQVLSGQSSSVGGGRALGGPLRLGKLHYVAHVNDDLSFSFVPLGAEGQDVTEVVNVLQGQGLTAFSSQGPALFSYCKGSALGATVSGSKFAFSLAQYLSGWGNHVSGTESISEEDPLCYSTLGQFLFQPSEGFILSFCGLNRYWPTPPLPSSMALHWTEMGPLIFPRIKSEKAISTRASMGPHMNRLPPHWEASDLECGPNVFGSKGTGLLSLAVSSSFDLGENMSLSGWAQVERGELVHDPDNGNFQWALTLAKTSGRGIEWGASIGGYRRDIWNMSSSSYDDYAGHNRVDLHGPQLHVEAFLKLSCGKGFTLQPGLLYVSDNSSHTPAFIVRSNWSL